MRPARPLGARFLLLGLLLAGCSAGGSPPEPPPALEPDPHVVRVAPEALSEIAVKAIQEQPLAEASVFTGRIQYSLDGFVKVGTPLTGIVKTIPVRLGDLVKAGQTLATIESADIGVAYADFAKAESDLRLGRRYFELSNDLYAAKSLSKKEFDQAKNDLNKTEAEYARARQRLLMLHVPAGELAKPAPERHIGARFDLKAPLAGTVVEKNVTLGQVVGQDPTQTLFTVADLDTLQVVAEIYERDLRFLRAGMPATVTVESFPHDRFPAKVLHVGESVNPDSRTIQVRCNVQNLGAKLKSGMFAHVAIQRSAGLTMIAIPREAVLRIGGDSFVFVEREPGEYERRPIAASQAIGEMVDVRHGITDGDRVVMQGAILLQGVLDQRR